MTVQKIATSTKYFGLSTDTKPVAPIGSEFIETDTLDSFMCYDGTNWTKNARNSERDLNADWRKNL